MKKSLAICFLLALFLICITQSIHAQDFQIERSIVYEIDENPQAQVTQQVSIVNLTTQKFPDLYQTKFRDVSIEEISVTGKNKKTLEWHQQTEDQLTTISVKLPGNVGKNIRTDFTIEFKINRAAIKQGQVTEVSLPEIIPQPNETIDLKVAVAKSLGTPAFMHPQPQNYTSNTTQMLYEFDVGKTENTGIKIAFGEHQIYQFTIFYHVSDELKKGINYELVIPPDTAYQRVALTQFSQTPTSIQEDEDGNWIAKYPIIGTNSPVVITGSIMSFASPLVPIENHPSSKLTASDQYWESDGMLIRTKAQELKTSEKIYKYVVNQLHYNYDKLNSNQNRLGAFQSLQNPTQANCREFSDTFTAMMRSVGIPTRVVIGYAQADNPKTQPLSYSLDILHAWPEYYDSQSNNWHPVDPTWEQTTGGYDYFNNWDLKHLTFVINGSSSSKPLAPGFQTSDSQSKNILVVPTNTMPPDEHKTHLTISVGKWFIPFISDTINVTLHNDSLQALHQQTISINDGTRYKIIGNSQQSLGSIPPLGEKTQTFTIKSKHIILPGQILINISNAQDQITIPIHIRIAQIVIFSVYIILYAIACIFTARLAKQAWRLHLP